MSNFGVPIFHWGIPCRILQFQLSLISIDYYKSVSAKIFPCPCPPSENFPCPSPLSNKVQVCVFKFFAGFCPIRADFFVNQFFKKSEFRSEIFKYISHLTLLKWEFWNEILISLHRSENFEMRISSHFIEVRFWNEIFFSHFRNEILKWESHFKISLASKWENNYQRNIILDIPGRINHCQYEEC